MWPILCSEEGEKAQQGNVERLPLYIENSFLFPPLAEVMPSANTWHFPLFALAFEISATTRGCDTAQMHMGPKSPFCSPIKPPSVGFSEEDA